MEQLNLIIHTNLPHLYACYRVFISQETAMKFLPPSEEQEEQEQGNTDKLSIIIHTKTK